ncbi:uncharacterized protein LOC126830713 [Patella vulgata]|uniref:uncharacterized protein LOC126830713 n=1 Tax=Patella vulgata TaxID=6465 RepID=UPI0024A7B6D3|nr:uncharacterized protein LOC126830713 [Patella vulgata]
MITDNDCDEANLEQKLQDGHVYYVTVQAINGAGLSTTLISHPVTVDTTPPTTGHVIDILNTNYTGDDVDYITNESPLSVRWQGFHDPHSSMQYYTVKVGTCDDCDDIIPEIKTGISTHFTFPPSKLTPGTKYITTVTGCNMADMCTSAISDGVIIDVTPPDVGRVLDGTKDLDVEFQATRNFVGAKWHGFKDAQSGIARYEWRVGTTIGGEELLSPQILPVVELTYKSNLPDNKLLPTDTRIYITVRCYNKAGLYSEVTSNGFKIDTTLPVVVQRAVPVSTFSSILPSTTISKSSIKIEWKFTDDESDIERQYISISPHLLGDFNSSAMEIPSVVTEFTFSGLVLHDGSKYKVKVIGCNLAGLCQSSVTDDITVDSTSPTRGMFAIDTDHAANLNRDRNNWNHWSTTSIKLAWLGFADLHTGITEYKVSVGTKPFFTDLNQGDRQTTFQHVAGDNFNDEGMVQSVTITTKTLHMGNSVFISVWAVNGVGLKCQPAHSEFELVEGGMLDLVRRCQPYNCLGHCVCAAQDKTCSDAENCSDISTGNPNNIIQVTDMNNLMSSDAAQTYYTSSNNFLAARWSIINLQGISPIRYECSAGHSGENSPSGIYDTDTERTWFDVGENTETIITVPTAKVLDKSITYSVFVRVWYNTNQYAVFKSPGITPLTSAPSVNHIAGAAIKELETISSVNDIDYQTSSNQIIVGWKNKFRGGIHGFDYFKPYISTHPQDIYDKDYQYSTTVISSSWYGFTDSGTGIVKYYWCIGTDISTTDCNIHDWKNVGLNTRVSVNLTSPLNHGMKIYNKVYAVDGSGLKSDVAVSDGTTIDTTPPVPVDIDYIGENLIANPSFEEGVTESNKECDDQPPAPWYIDSTSCIKIIQSPPSVSKEGGANIKVKSHIQQTVFDLNTQSAYHVIIHVGYPHDVSIQHDNVEGFVQFGQEIHTFSLDPERCQGICDIDQQPLILWNKFTYVFHPREAREVIRIGTSKLHMMMYMYNKLII